MSVIEISSSSEFNKYIDGSKLVLVDFYATWCGPCRAIAPRIDEMAKSNPNVTFLKVDTDKNSDIAQRCGISAMPTFQFYQKGKKLDEVVGADIGSIRSKLYSLSKSSGSSSAFSGKGYHLGTGKVVYDGQQPGGSGQANAEVNVWNWLLIALLALFLYEWFIKGSH